MSIEEDLGKMLRKAAIDGTLSETAIDHYDSLIKENRALSESLKEKQEQFRQADTERTDLRKALTAEQDRNATMEEREVKCAELEKNDEILQLTVKYEKKRVEDHQNMVGMIFRNSVLRRSVLGQELVAIPGTPDTIDQYGNRQYGTGREPDVTGVDVRKTEEETET